MEAFGSETDADLTVTATFQKEDLPESTGDVHIYQRDIDNGNWIRVGEETTSEDTISAAVKLPGTFALLSHNDARPPALELTFDHQGFVDGDYISDTPPISARIEDANGDRFTSGAVSSSPKTAKACHKMNM